MTERERKIIHIDMDAFYASVEQLDNPKLMGLPIAVGGSGNRGVVSAASYEARKYGVRSAMSGIIAKKICPQITFVKPRFKRYKEISTQIRNIFNDKKRKTQIPFINLFHFSFFRSIPSLIISFLRSQVLGF